MSIRALLNTFAFRQAGTSTRGERRQRARRARRRNPARPPTVERVESRVLLSAVPTAALPAATARLVAATDTAAPPAQGHVAQELVPGGIVLRSVRPALPLSAAAPGTATPPPRQAGAFDIVLKKGPNLAANVAASAAFEQAAVFFETIFSDAVTVVVDAEVAALPPGVISSTGFVQFSGGYATVRDAVVNDRAANEQIAGLIPTTAQFTAFLPNDPANPFSLVGAVANRANLLAVGFPASQLPGPASMYDPTVFVDMDVTFSTAYPFDYDRSNGISAGLFDFTAAAIHEIGHGLGFSSEVDYVDFLQSNPGFNRQVWVSPLDMFRMQPGGGQASFTTNPRVMAPGRVVANQVFYDGGVFSPTGVVGIPGLTMGDIPMSTGVSNGDGRNASHWKDNTLINTQIGLMDPTAAGNGRQLDWTMPDSRAMGLIGWDVDTTAPTVSPGTFQFEVTPNRLRYAFNEPVQLSLGPADLLVQRLEAGGPVTVTPSSFGYDPATNTATFTFSGALPQGNYRATLRAAGVSDFAGNAVAADHVLEFFVLAGDINRDRMVNGSDFAILAANFGRTGRTYEQGDLNGDARVDGSDFAILAGNFGKSMAPPTPSSLAAAVGAPEPQAPRRQNQKVNRHPRGRIPLVAAEDFPGHLSRIGRSRSDLYSDLRFGA
jgi:hypothetical protein